MENFVLGIQAIGHSIAVTTRTLLKHPVVWGFALGYAASTGLHAFVVAGHPRHLFHMVTKPPRRCYGLLCPPKRDGRPSRSYDEFCRDHARIRTLFYSTLLTFLGVVLVALVRY